MLVQEKTGKVSRRTAGAAEASPVKFDHSFKVSRGLTPESELSIEQAAVQERFQVFCAVIDKNYNTEREREK